MKIVLQCAATKYNNEPGAGFRDSAGRPVKFVGEPAKAPCNDGFVYVKPDDFYDTHQTWRQYLTAYNKDENGNPFGLRSAYQLYQNSVYEKLVVKYGTENVFILSAGWGLIKSDFLTPYYDITFSKASNVPDFCRRKKEDRYIDYCHLTDDDKIVFIGGNDYLPLFVRLTSVFKADKIVYFNSKNQPRAICGYEFRLFKTTAKTNWHYLCANELINGELAV